MFSGIYRKYGKIPAPPQTKKNSGDTFISGVPYFNLLLAGGVTFYISKSLPCSIRSL
jgi:hypothetical protein